MKRMEVLDVVRIDNVFLCILICVSLALGFASNASANAFLEDNVIASPGGTARFKVSLDANATGIEGLTFSVWIVGSGTYVPDGMAVTSAVEHPDLTALFNDGFKFTEKADAGSLGGTDIGGIGSYVLSFAEPAEFPSGLTGLGIYDVFIPSTVPAGTVFNLEFVDGMQGSGLPVSNCLTISGSTDLLDECIIGSITVASNTMLPKANAGLDQIVFHEITLDGTDSSDPDGSIESYEWQLNHRDDAEHNRTAQGENPTVSNLKPGFYDVILTMTDNHGLTDTDEMVFSAIGRKGDLNLDGEVDGNDLAEFADMFGSSF